MTPLDAVLSDREERAAVQSRLLQAEPTSFLIQTALNIPGFPKRVAHDEVIVAYVCTQLQQRFGAPALDCVQLVGGAGFCANLVFAGDRRDALRMKSLALDLEEEHVWGRLLDLDVITADGAITRETLGIEPRRCLLCVQEAKQCAAGQTHGLEAVRKAALWLAQDFNGFISSPKAPRPLD